MYAVRLLFARLVALSKFCIAQQPGVIIDILRLKSPLSPFLVRDAIWDAF